MFSSIPWAMLGGRFHCNLFVLDESSDDDEVTGALGSLSDDLASGLGGLTIMSAANDTSWLGISGLPARPPQSAPARIHAPAARSSLGALSVTSSMMDPPSLRTSIPAGGAGSGRGGGMDGFLPWISTQFGIRTLSYDLRSWYMLGRRTRCASG